MVKVQGIPLALFGETYVIPPLSLGALEQLQDKLANFAGDVRDGEQVKTVIDAAYLALRRNYPDIQRGQVAEMVDVGNMAEVFQAVMDVSGMKRKALESGEAQPGS